MCGGLRRLVVGAHLEWTDYGQTVADVEGIGDHSELAVADAVDPGGDLFGDNLPDSICETRLESRLVKLAAGLARLQERQQVRWTRQAAGMGRLHGVCAALHLSS